MKLELSVHPDVLIESGGLAKEAARTSDVPVEFIRDVVIRRRAIDARGGRVRVHLVVEVVLAGAETAASAPPRPPNLAVGTGEPQVVIIGAGPAGMFCAWELASHGIASRVLERGRPVRPRRKDVAALMTRGELDPESNYCFGEGGAGTFSDGKLYTRADKRGRVDDILQAFIAYGATPEIAIDARPHIGTNKLPGVVTTMREHLESAGVQFSFDTRAEGLVVRDGSVTGVRCGTDVVPAQAVVLATGHSARDVMRWVADAGAVVESKPFAMGVRVEHPQALIDRIQFGDLAGHPALGAASYRIVRRVHEAGAFSFCMCPGGVIAPASTERDAVVVNGWSPSARGGRFANSGFVVEVGASVLQAAGLDPSDPFSGLSYQRRLEQRAFVAGGGGFVAPAQRLSTFVRGATDDGPLPRTSYRRGTKPAELDDVLGLLAPPLRAAFAEVEARMPGYVTDDAVVVGVESRTSSPVRIVRDPTSGQSPSVAGLFPCAEGAGYAGGIMSAALDGCRVAGWIRASLR